jgi:superfamily II DNA or RNA helicase
MIIDIEVGPVWTYIRNWPRYDTNITRLREMCSFELPFTNSRYVVGDGRKYLIEIVNANDYRVPTGLIDRVLAFFLDLYNKDQKYIYQVHGYDFRNRSRTSLEFKTFALRPYQTRAVLHGLGVTESNIYRFGGILQAATGAGKTAMAAKMIAVMNTQTLFIVHTKDLLMQAKKAFESFLGIKVGVIGAGKRDIQPVTVATIQSLQSGHDDLLASVEFVLFDECHHVAAQTLYNTAMKLANVKGIVGLSASPWRDDNHDLMIEAVCGPVRHVITASDLIDEGFLVPPEITVYRRPLPPHLKKMHVDILSYHKAYTQIVTEDESRHRLVRDIAHEQMGQGRKVLVLVKQIDHGQKLESLIDGAIFVEGRTKLSERERIFQDFRDGKINCLIGTSLADEGIDIPCADALILAGAGSSSTRALQRIGRVIRPAPGKTSAFVADIVDENHSFQKQFYSRRKMYESERRFTIKTVNLPIDAAFTTR